MENNDGVWLVYKPLLLTPLQVLEELKKKHPETKQLKMTYAGRLDPLAEGVMIILSGDMIEQKTAFLALTKTYEFDLVLGISSDSYDLMGIPHIGKIPKNKKLYTLRLRQLLEELTGQIRLPYPAYSGKTMHGVKLFDLAKSGTLRSKNLPHFTGEVLSIELTSAETIPFSYLSQQAIERVRGVVGDFRQNEIITAWKSQNIPRETVFPSMRIRLACSSGVYVRSICHELGKRLNCGGLSSHILRTKVGGYTLEDCIHLTDN